jgi:hypothetical protein
MEFVTAAWEGLKFGVRFWVPTPLFFEALGVWIGLLTPFWIYLLCLVGDDWWTNRQKMIEISKGKEKDE